MLNRKQWIICEELRLAIVTWMELPYCRSGCQRSFGKPTPIEVETIYAPDAIAA